MKQVKFYFDFLSPYSYLAHSQLGFLDAEIDLVPIPVLDLMALVNNTPTTLTCAVKTAYAQRDLARWAERYGLPFAFADYERLDGDLLLRIATAASEPPVRSEVVRLIFEAVWGGRGDASPDGVKSLLASAKLPADDILAAAVSDRVRETLRRATEQAAAAGVFGAPTLQVADELFFGNDRLDFVRSALTMSGDRR